MALFEFEDGHLVPAQFGYPVAQDLGPDLVDAICQQVLQFVPNKDTRRTGTPDTCEPDNSACYDSEGKEIL